MASLSGFRIVESQWLTEAGPPTEVRRTWRERLLSRPWRPWKATRIVVLQVPSRQVYMMGDSMVVHPVFLRELMAKQFTHSYWPIPPPASKARDPE